MMLKKYFDDYDSEEDENYEPTAKENRVYEQQHMRKRGAKRDPSMSPHELYLKMKKQYLEKDAEREKQKERKPDLNTVQLANAILNSDSIKPNKRITFAGKEYILNEETGQLETVERKNPVESLDQGGKEDDIEAYQMKARHISYQYLNHVMQAIYNRSKKINAIGKSKLDWRGFVRQEGIEDRLHYNRKGGVIQNMQFIRNTK